MSPSRNKDWRTGNRSLPVGVSCSWEQRINPTCLAGSVTPAGAIPGGTSITYLRMVFPVSSLSSLSGAAESGATNEKTTTRPAMDICFIVRELYTNSRFQPRVKKLHNLIRQRVMKLLRNEHS